ncbi:MAG: hypothetical protein JOY90_39005 [Bradyrhizobium sp.]|nr:hypothetical protein [Bradyrhizobium sp.]
MRGTVHIFMSAVSGVLLLAACAADSHAPLPAFMRAQASDPPPELPPDVKQLVHDRLDGVFVNTSYPRNVQVSPPHHEVRGTGWTACVRAELTSATGKPLGVQTYRISINDGQIMDRQRADAGDNCDSERYEPI